MADEQIALRLVALKKELSITASYFRLCQEGQANDSYAKVLASVIEMLPLLTSQQTEHLQLILPLLHEAIENRDYLYVADILEYELTRLL